MVTNFRRIEMMNLRRRQFALSWSTPLLSPANSHATDFHYLPGEMGRNLRLWDMITGGLSLRLEGWDVDIPANHRAAILKTTLFVS